MRSVTRELRLLLAGAALVLTSAVLALPSAAATELSVAGPGAGTWQIGQMWHGGSLGDGIVPAGTSIDLSPISGSPKDVYAVAAGRIVRTCVSPTQSTVFVDSVGIGVIGYSHLATGSILTGGNVAQGQRLGTLATTYVKSACATSWTGPHLHLSFPARYDVLKLAGQKTSRYAVLQFPTPRLATTFLGRPGIALSLTATAARVDVCADNLPGDVVVVRLNLRATSTSPGRSWSASKVATSRCVRFENLDGAGRVLRGRTYVARAALNQNPSTSWSYPGCYRATGGQGLCDRALFR
ncbi:MAG: M23 family metallopeptidase [Propionibacteriales bacterium]|nr:M23 family metallopeptidase [Propionibacteriales bacterium]